LAALQAYGFTVLFQNQNPPILSPNLDWFSRTTIIITLTAGTILLMWFGELITERGIGNGISLLIFAGIIGRGPRTLISTIQAHSGGNGLADFLPFVVFAVIALVVTIFIIWVQQAVRKIPIQSAQRVAGGSRTIQARASFLPLRVNQAGVIPIIFAISIMFFPTIVASYLANAPSGTWYANLGSWIQGNFSPTGPNLTMDVIYNVLYFAFVFGFTYFYTFVTFEPADVADNLKRYSSFIPGIRPGRPTAEYLTTVMYRVTFAGAIFLGVITVLLPLVTAKATNIPQQQMYLGGTAILIVVGVALDTMKQLETQLIMRQYRGFIR
jgi:preprotein translocase subunit SecY